ncbi:MAG: sulfurtransferase [Kofleriaceae bacterium]|nr:sulfurtransferase [Kofleriaceae bacterium]
MKSPLISVSALLPQLRGTSLRLIDIRKASSSRQAQAMYAEGHIPGAISLDLESDLSASEGPGRHPLPSASAFSLTLETAGIGPEHNIVCYDNFGGALAARAWWMLESIGHKSVFVLDGGIEHWQRAGHALQNSTPSYPKARWHSASATRQKTNCPTVDRQSLADNLADTRIIDARAAERFRGETEPLDPVAGHILGSISAPYADNLIAGRFKPADELRQRFSRLGILSAKGIVCSCGSGVTACHNILAMRIAGLGQATLYPGSWSDWCESNLPMVPSSGR